VRILAIAAAFASILALARAEARTLVYGGDGIRYFGPDVLHQPGWDRYLMFLTANSAVVNGRPGAGSGDSQHYNHRCNTSYADRIWVTWNMGSGLDAVGWRAAEPVTGTVPPLLMLTVGGPGESALIGDPAVVQWNGQWHMFYEGTDDCSGANANIFHAVASDWHGPWRKTGLVSGLWGIRGTTSGLSWPTILVESNQLYLYFTDEAARIRAAKAISSDGTSFLMMNYDGNKPIGGNNPAPVSPDTANRGKVVKSGNQYVLFYDNFGRSEIRYSVSNSPFSFSAGTHLIGIADQGVQDWENFRTGLPSVLYENGQYRIYYTGESTSKPDGASGTIGVTTMP
jgi:hypothetical protein